MGILINASGSLPAKDIMDEGLLAGDGGNVIMNGSSILRNVPDNVRSIC